MSSSKTDSWSQHTNYIGTNLKEIKEQGKNQALKNEGNAPSMGFGLP